MTDTRPVVLVTGAGGFVGRHLVPVLAAEGWRVRRAVRTLSRSDDEVSIGSIGPVTDWQAALDGVEAVVHLAARVHHPGEESAGELYRAVNTEGTLHLARCAAAAGVRRFVHVSTVLVNGSSTDGRLPFREDDIPAPRGVYGNSKAAAEAGLKQLAETVDMRIAVIRPPLIYGAGALGNLRLLVRAIQRGISTSVRRDPQSPRFPGGRESHLVHREPAVRRGAQIRYFSGGRRDADIDAGIRQADRTRGRQHGAPHSGAGAGVAAIAENERTPGGAGQPDRLDGNRCLEGCRDRMAATAQHGGRPSSGGVRLLRQARLRKPVHHTCHGGNADDDKHDRDRG